MGVLARFAAVVVLAAAVVAPTSSEAAVWDDDAGLVLFGRGYEEPTQYADAFNALEGRTLTQIAGTSGNTCAIDENGEAVCWGSSDKGSHGTGARPFSPDGPAAVSVSGALRGKTLIDIDAGGGTCAVDDAGQAYCWGSNRHGQLGQPSVFRTAYSPVKVYQRPLPDGAGFVDVTTGDLHTCAITNGGDAYCWGSNLGGQLGTGNKKDADRPTKVKAGDIGGRRLVAIDAGFRHTCAVDAGGRAYCWGENYNGTLGTGHKRSELVPAKVAGTGPNGRPMATVSAGGSHTCASAKSRRPFCWGSNTFHQVSPSDRGAFLKPHKIATGRVSDISAGDWYTCAVVEATDIYCWGRNSDGQIGDGTKELAKAPTKVKTPGGGLNGTEPEQVQATYNTTCAMDAAGVAYCWGSQGSWMAGRTWRPALTPKPVAATPTGLDGEALTELTDAGFSWCAMRSPTQPTCWSEGPFTEPTYNRLRGTFRDVATDGVIGGAPLHSLDTGTEIACALDDNGKAFCWGNGALGVPGTYKSRDPVAVDTSGVLAGKTLVDIATDEAHTCVVDDAGKAYCWGEDNFGEVGNGDDDSTQVPAKVVGKGVLKGEVLVAIQTTMFNTCALSDDGDVFCWGGWLGDGSGTTSQTPVRTDLSMVSAGETVTSLQGSYDTPCLITDAGHAYCWGSSYRGQTGTGKVTGSVIRPTPVVRDGVLSGQMLTKLVMPTNTTMCGLSAAGRIYCWGDDQYGLLGNGDFNGRSSVPVAVVNDGVLAGAVVTDLGASADIVWAVATRPSAPPATGPEGN